MSLVWTWIYIVAVVGSSMVRHLSIFILTGGNAPFCIVSLCCDFQECNPHMGLISHWWFLFQWLTYHYMTTCTVSQHSSHSSMCQCDNTHCDNTHCDTEAVDCQLSFLWCNLAMTQFSLQNCVLNSLNRLCKASLEVTKFWYFCAWYITLFVVIRYY